MKIPEDAVIPPEKLTEYLLKPRERDDKSKFLAQVGFVREQPKVLQDAIRRMAAAGEAIADGESEYGVFYRMAGPLEGPTGVLAVIVVWLRWRANQSVHFVTLKPDRETKP